ncbi:AraC-type DNA-binding protein [Saccharopolyspora antimicrobica]|uniref:AraC family transcriptional regulator n=1 Tax=Saccharopolyspora antimicrobica TaxID=455193 RepID=A0A1I5GKV1_9PSEU|nr:AraC family transcriptional regulator [Saccharopolyspora antimicrobica]RKT87489.1 AraC family transcriptional regulator [Saccharopolyspora antimicrobica]SFO36615.1 AraC-type DNA-binding protein [Saccharopolyspora antimicrobica]
MDVLTGLLRGIRAESTLFRRAELPAPWSSNSPGEASLALCAVVRGHGWLLPGRGEPTLLEEGDVAISSEPFSVVSSLPSAERAADGHTVLLLGGYQLCSNSGRRLVDALPPLLVLPHDGCDPVLEFVAAEVASIKPGQDAVLERLLDWFLLCALRAWFDRPEALPSAWHRALSDPVVGLALQAMHEEPARPWTVASLAEHSGVSRATLARRFTALVGEPPLSYLTDWRMSLATELLAEPGATVSSVAKRVGYADGFGFSSAFKRARGISPSAVSAGRGPRSGRLCAPTHLPPQPAADGR